MKASGPTVAWMAGSRTDVEGVPNLPKEFCMLQEPSRTPLAPDRSPNTVTAKREDSIMNSKRNFTNHSWECFNWLLAALALALTVSAHSETQPAAIPFSDIGVRGTANYKSADRHVG